MTSNFWLPHSLQARGPCTIPYVDIYDVQRVFCRNIQDEPIGCPRPPSSSPPPRFFLGMFNGLTALWSTLVAEICGKEHDIVGTGVLTSECRTFRSPKRDISCPCRRLAELFAVMMMMLKKNRACVSVRTILQLKV